MLILRRSRAALWAARSSGVGSGRTGKVGGDDVANAWVGPGSLPAAGGGPGSIVGRVVGPVGDGPITGSGGGGPCAGSARPASAAVVCPVVCPASAAVMRPASARPASAAPARYPCPNTSAAENARCCSHRNRRRATAVPVRYPAPKMVRTTTMRIVRKIAMPLPRVRASPRRPGQYRQVALPLSATTATGPHRARIVRPRPEPESRVNEGTPAANGRGS